MDPEDYRVRARAPRGSRPRTKRRPDYSHAARGMVVTVDRGRYAAVLPDGTQVTAMKARELGRRAIVVGDTVALVGDLSGRKDTLARIVAVDPRTHELRRSSDEAQISEKVMVAGATQLVIVTALADPEPRPRLVDRYLVAAYDADMVPLLVLTKSDLADPGPFLEQFAPLGLDAVVTHTTPNGIAGLDELRRHLAGVVSVLVGHSGVGKSTLVNALVPGADRATGDVNAVTGKGRHTSSSAVALPLPGGGWVIDTPGVRSFGLDHVSPESLLRGFTDLAAAAQDCPRGCTHADDAPDCALDDWARGDQIRLARLASYRRLLAAR